MIKKKKAGLESLFITSSLQSKEAAIKDPTELFIKIVEYILDRAPGEYATAQDLFNDMTKKFDDVLKIMKDNFERWKKTEAPQLLKTMGIELMDQKNKAEFEITDESLQQGQPAPEQQVPGQPGEETPEEEEGPTLDENFFEEEQSPKQGI